MLRVGVQHCICLCCFWVTPGKLIELFQKAQMPFSSPRLRFSPATGDGIGQSTGQGYHCSFLYRHIFSLSLRDQAKGNIWREITGKKMSRNPYFQFTQLAASFRLKYLRLVKPKMHQCWQLFGKFSLTTFNPCPETVILLCLKSMSFI